MWAKNLLLLALALLLMTIAGIIIMELLKGIASINIMDSIREGIKCGIYKMLTGRSC